MKVASQPWTDWTDCDNVPNKKINETAQMANFTDFPLIICGKGP